VEKTPGPTTSYSQPPAKEQERANEVEVIVIGFEKATAISGLFA
jgi:hypothetical protein